MEPDETKESKIDLLLGQHKDISSLLENAMKGRASRQKEENLSWAELSDLKHYPQYSPGNRGPKGLKEETISEEDQKIIKIKKIEESIREKKLELALLENKLKRMKEDTKKHKRRSLNI